MTDLSAAEQRIEILSKIDNELSDIGKMIEDGGCATVKSNIASWDSEGSRQEGTEEVKKSIEENGRGISDSRKEHRNVWNETQQSGRTDKETLSIEEPDSPRERLLNKFRGILGDDFGRVPSSGEKQICTIECLEVISKQVEAPQPVKDSHQIRGKENSTMEVKDGTPKSKQTSPSRSDISSPLEFEKASSGIKSTVCVFVESSLESNSISSATAESKTKSSNFSEESRTSVMPHPKAVKYSKYIVENWIADNDAIPRAEENFDYPDRLSIISVAGGGLMERPCLDVEVWNLTKKRRIAEPEREISNIQNLSVDVITHAERISTSPPPGQLHGAGHVYARRTTTSSLDSPPITQMSNKRRKSIPKFLAKIFPFLRSKDAQTTSPATPDTPPTPESERRAIEKERMNSVEPSNENHFMSGALPATPKNRSSRTERRLRNASREAQCNLNTKSPSMHSSLNSSRGLLVNPGSIIYPPRSTSPLKHSGSYNFAKNMETQPARPLKQRRYSAPTQSSIVPPIHKNSVGTLGKNRQRRGTESRASLTAADKYRREEREKYWKTEKRLQIEETIRRARE